MAILPKRRIQNPATQQEIDTTNRNAAIIGGGLLLLTPGGLLRGLTAKGIKSLVKKAGSIGNTKKPDTVGNRLKSAQAIFSKEDIAKNLNTFAGRKTQRTLMNAVRQGPSKFFSSGRSAKTGIAAGKRDSGRISERAYNRDRQIAGVRDKLSLSPGDKLQVKRIEKESLFANKEILKQTLLSNKKARTALGKRSSGNNPKTGIRAGKRVFGKEQSDGYAYGYDHSRIENSVNATKYTNYGSVKAERFMDKNEVKFISSNKVERARKELSKGLPKGQIDYDPKHIREKFFQNKSLTKYDIKLAEDVYPSNIIKRLVVFLRKIMANKLTKMEKEPSK